MYNQHHGTHPGLNLRRADRMPALFSRFVGAVQAHEAARASNTSAANSNEIPSCFCWLRRFFP